MYSSLERELLQLNFGDFLDSTFPYYLNFYDPITLIQDYVYNYHTYTERRPSYFWDVSAVLLEDGSVPEYLVFVYYSSGFKIKIGRLPESPRHDFIKVTANNGLYE